MDEEEKAEDEEVDFESAMEAALEVSPELHRHFGGTYFDDGRGFYIEESLTDEELERRMGELLKEMNVRVNEIYRRKKRERSN